MRKFRITLLYEMDFNLSKTMEEIVLKKGLRSSKSIITSEMIIKDNEITILIPNKEKNNEQEINDMKDINKDTKNTIKKNVAFSFITKEGGIGHAHVDAECKNLDELLEVLEFAKQLRDNMPEHNSNSSR